MEEKIPTYEETQPVEDKIPTYEETQPVEDKIPTYEETVAVDEVDSSSKKKGNGVSPVSGGTSSLGALPTKEEALNAVVAKSQAGYINPDLEDFNKPQVDRQTTKKDTSVDDLVLRTKVLRDMRNASVEKAKALPAEVERLKKEGEDLISQYQSQPSPQLEQTIRAKQAEYLQAEKAANRQALITEVYNRRLMETSDSIKKMANDQVPDGIYSAMYKGIKGSVKDTEKAIEMSRASKEEQIQWAKDEALKAPTTEPGMVEQGAEMVGGVIPDIATAIGFSLVGLPVAGVAAVSARQGAQQAGQDFVRAFNAAQEDGKNDDEAYDIATKAAGIGFATGAAEGLVGAATGHVGAKLASKAASKVTGKVIEKAVDTGLDATIAGTMQVGRNVFDRYQGLKTDISEGVAANMLGEIALSGPVNTYHGVSEYINDRKKSTADIIEAIKEQPKNPYKLDKLEQNVEVLKETNGIKESDYQRIKTRISTLKSQIESGVPEEKAIAVADREEKKVELTDVIKQGDTVLAKITETEPETPFEQAQQEVLVGKVKEEQKTAFDELKKIATEEIDEFGARKSIEAMLDKIANAIQPNIGNPEYVKSERERIKNNPLGNLDRMIDYLENNHIPQEKKENSSLLIYSERQLEELKDLKKEYLSVIEKESGSNPSVEQQVGVKPKEVKPEQLGSGVGGDMKPTPQKVKVLGKDVNMYNDYIPSKVEDIEPNAMYSFNANSKDGIPSLLHDISYANKREVNGVKSENWHASISGEELLKLYPKEQSLPTQEAKVKEEPKEVGSVGVGGDVESTTNVFNETQKSNPTVWQKIKDAFYNVVGKVHEGFKNTQDFIDNAINGDTQFSELAKALKDKLGDIKTSFVDDLRNKEGKLAYGKHNKDGITVSRKSPHPLQTWFHEAVHKLTVDKLYDYEEGNLHKLSDKDIEAIQNLHRIFGNVQKILNDKGIETKQHNPFKNVREFVAEALTNPEFQEILNKFKGEGKSPTLLKQFLDAVSKLLGLKDGSILDDVFHHTENLFNEGKSEQKNIAEAYHDAKSKGIENDFTKAVEELLGNTNETTTQQAEAEKVATPPVEDVVAKDEVDELIINARKGDKQAQATLNENGLGWEEKPKYRIIGQQELDVLDKEGKVKSNRDSGHGKTDITDNPEYGKVGGGEGTYRVKFKNTNKFDSKMSDTKTREKNAKEGEFLLEGEYTNDDIEYVEKLVEDEKGNKTWIKLENEATPKSNTPTDGNVQLGASNVGESGNSKQESPVQESVPSSVDGGEVKGDVEVTIGKNNHKFYTGRKTKIEDFSKTKGEFIFFSKDKKVSEHYGGDNITEANVDTSGFLDLSTQEKKTAFVKENFTDEDIHKLYPNIKRNAFDRQTNIKGFEEIEKEIIQGYRTSLENNRFSGDGEVQNAILRKIKAKGHTGVVLEDSFFGKKDMSYVVFDKSVINSGKTTETPQPKSKGDAGKIIEPHSEVNTDVETVKQELKLDPIDSLIYDEFNNLPKSEISKKVDKIKDDKYGEIEKIESDINDLDIKIEDNGIEIDQINDAENLTPAKKKKAVAEKEKEYKEFQKQQKELESKKEATEKFLEDFENKLFHSEEDFNQDAIDKVLDKVNTRLETRKAVKNGTDLFPETANIPELEKTPSRKEKRIKAVEASIDDLANALKDLLPSAPDTEGLKKQGLSQDDIIDFIAKAAKELAKTGIEIDEAIRQVIGKLNERFEDLNVDEKLVKEKLGVEKPQDFEPQQGKKSVAGRMASGNSAIIKKAIANNSLDYEIENQKEAKEKADAFVDEVGFDNALIAVRDGLVDGGQGAFIYARAIEILEQEINYLKGEDKLDAVADYMKLLDEIAVELDLRSRKYGQFISALANIYYSSKGRYNLTKMVKDYKAENGGVISKEVLEKLKNVEEKLKESEAKLAELEAKKRIEEENEAFNNILESVARKKRINTNAKISDKQKAKAFADKLRSFKISNNANLSAATPFSIAYDLAIETAAKAIEVSGLVSDAIKAGVNSIRNSKLSKDEQEQALSDLFDLFDDSDVNVGKKGMMSVDEEGVLRIPHSLIREKVENGIDNIDDLVSALMTDVQELFPDLDFTERQVRDIVTGYGKISNPTSDEIEVQISIMKSLGKIASGLEDVNKGQRPLRSGQQRREPTMQERVEMKKLKALLRDLPLAEADIKKAYKTALDAIKKRLSNEIEELDEQIDNGEKRKGQKTVIEYDQEAKDLKAVRDAKKAELDELVGKPELTEQQKIDRSEKILQKRLDDLQQKIDTNEIDYAKKPESVTSAKLEEMRKLKKEYEAQIQKMREDAGLAEERLIEIAKRNASKRLAALKERIAKGDFEKRKRKPTPTDVELNKIKSEIAEQKEIFDKEVYKLELKNRRIEQKAFDVLKDILSIPKILSFTADLSFVGIQNVTQIYKMGANSLINLAKTGKLKGTFRDAMAKTFKAMANPNFEQKYMQAVKANPNYQLWKDSKLGIVESHYKESAKAEVFQHNAITTLFDILGNYVASKGYGKAGDIIKNYVNIISIFERGQTVFENQMRINRFQEGADLLKAQGFNPVDDIQEYRKVAAAVNTLTGRANTGSKAAAALREANGTIFSSFSNWAAGVNQLNPYWYYTLTPTARKMALTDVAHHIVGAGSLLGMAALYALGQDDDDEDKIVVGTTPTSSDFALIKAGNLRIDPWAGKKTTVVAFSRLVNGGKTDKYGNFKKYGIEYEDEDWIDLPLEYAGNKIAPGPRFALDRFFKTKKVEYQGKSFREDKYGVDFKESKYLIPLIFENFREVNEEQPNLFGKAAMALSWTGLINTNVYGGAKEGFKDMPDDLVEKEYKTKIQKLKDNEKILDSNIEKLTKDYVEKKINKFQIMQKVDSLVEGDTEMYNKTIKSIIEKINKEELKTLVTDPFYLGLKKEKNPEIQAILFYNKFKDDKGMSEKEKKERDENLQYVEFDLSPKFIKAYQELLESKKKNKPVN